MPAKSPGLRGSILLVSLGALSGWIPSYLKGACQADVVPSPWLSAIAGGSPLPMVQAAGLAFTGDRCSEGGCPQGEWLVGLCLLCLAWGLPVFLPGNSLKGPQTSGMRTQERYTQMGPALCPPPSGLSGRVWGKEGCD